LADVLPLRVRVREVFLAAIGSPGGQPGLDSGSVKLALFLSLICDGAAINDTMDVTTRYAANSVCLMGTS